MVNFIKDCELGLESPSFQSLPARFIQQARQYLFCICNHHTQSGQCCTELSLVSEYCFVCGDSR